VTGETERFPSGWTTDTVKVLEDEKIASVERLFASEIRRLEAIIKAAGEAVALLGTANQVAQDKFEATVRDGFVKQNEFRGSLDDLGKTMATRRELEAFAAQLGELRSRIDVGPAALAALQNQSNIQRGRQEGIGVSANVVAFCVTTLVALVAITVTAYILTRHH
jgi:hypothetical protein